jgi:ABC-type multidrug transport system fused ATPase/permease subunit
VTIDASDVRSFTLESLRGQVSIVQQESVLFGLSIAENIRYGRPEASDEEVRAAAEAAGLDELVARLPEGYDTVLTERGASLSGGQRQLLSIARALVRSSPILVLDEPTTGLDTVSQTRVVDAVRRLIRGTTTLFVTHDMRLVREASEIVVLDRGRLVARGTYDELIARSPIFRRWPGSFRIQSRRECLASPLARLTARACSSIPTTAWVSATSSASSNWRRLIAPGTPTRTSSS